MSEKKHYVDNEKFFNAMVDWKTEYKESVDAGDPKPPVTEYIGDCWFHKYDSTSDFLLNQALEYSQVPAGLFKDIRKIIT